MAGQRETIKISNLTITPSEALEMADGNRLTAEIGCTRGSAPACATVPRR